MSSENKDFLQRAFADGHLQLITSGKTEKIRYVAVNVAEKWSDPRKRCAPPTMRS